MTSELLQHDCGLLMALPDISSNHGIEGLIEGHARRIARLQLDVANASGRGAHDAGVGAPTWGWRTESERG